MQRLVKKCIGIAFVLVLTSMVQVQAARVGHWHMDEASWNVVADEVIDGSGYANNGIGYNGATTISGGISGRCADFNTVNAFSVIPNAVSLRNFTAKTVMFWIKAQPGQGWTVPYEHNYWNTGYGDLIAFDGTNNKVEFYLKNTAGAMAYKDANCPVNEWTMIGYTWDGTTATFYVDGASVGTQAFSGTLSCNNDMQIAHSAAGIYYKGKIDEFKIYNNALTAQEIALVGNWAMEGISWNAVTDEVVDGSGYGNSGTGYNGATMVSGGVFGNCGSFDGVNDFVAIPNALSLRNYTSKTVVFWVKPSLTAWRVAYEHHFWAGTFGDLIATYDDNGTMKADMYVKNTAGTQAHIAAPISASDWTMVGYTWDGTNVIFYVNGVSVGTVALSGILGCDGDMQIANDSGNPTLKFGGLIDEFRVYRTALTAQEMAVVGNGCWHMDEASWNIVPDEIIDSSGYDSGGIGYGGATTVLGGVSGRCGSFDGVNDYASIDNNPSLRNFTAKTVMFWIKAQPGQGWTVPYEHNYWSTGYGDLIAFDGTNNKVEFYLKNTAGAMAYKDANCPVNEWTMIGYTWDGTTATFYVDGASVGTQAFSGTLSCNSNMLIGNSATSILYEGKIDELRVYNRALIATEVATLVPKWEVWPVSNVDKDMGQVAIDVNDGKVAVVYLQNFVSGGDAKLRYSEYLYNPYEERVLAVQDEIVPNAVAYYGTDIRGIACEPNGTALIAVIPKTSPSQARVLERWGDWGFTYIVDDAQDVSTAPQNQDTLGGSHESFGLDSAGNRHFVWSTNTASPQIVHAVKTSGTWSRTVMSASGVLSWVKPDMVLDSSNNPRVAYSDNNSGTSATFYTANMVSGSYVGDCVIGSPGAMQDIEIGANGYPMIAHIDTSVPGIVVEMYNGSSWDRTVVVSDIDPRAYSWYGIGEYINLEVGPDGNPAIVLAHLDDYDLGSDAKLNIDYYTYNGSNWDAGKNIGIFNSGGGFAQGIDFKFDEYGRPFVAVSTKRSSTGKSEVIILTPKSFKSGGNTQNYLDGDLNRDGYVNDVDYMIMSGEYNKCTAPDGDCDSNGTSHTDPKGFPPVLEIEGQPVFPIGWYDDSTAVDGNDYDAVLLRLQGIADTNSDFVMIGANADSILTTFASAAEAAGIKIIFDNRVADKEHQVNLLEDYDSVLGWYISDEPECYNTPASTIQGDNSNVKYWDSDPANHATFVIHSCAYSNRAKYLWPINYCDVMAFDYYPVNNGYAEFEGSLYAVSPLARYWSKVAGERGFKASFMTPQAFGQWSWRLPTYAEERYLTYAPIVYGVRGLFYFHYYYTTQAFLDDIMTPIIGQIKSLVPAIISNSIVVTTTSNRDTDTTGHMIEDVGYLFGQDTNYSYLIAVNNTAGTLSSVQFSLSGVGLEEAVGDVNSTIPVIFESRNVTLTTAGASKWTVTDNFTPYAVHVYRLYEVPTPTTCGDVGTVYKVSDINRDCYVDAADMDIMISNWLKCSDPANSNCEIYITNLADNPSPVGNAKGVNLVSTLSWMAGIDANSHDVYFGTNQTNVNNATHASSEYKGNQAGTTYDPNTLDVNTTYYWRIDEVDDGGTTKGTVWNFTTDF